MMKYEPQAYINISLHFSFQSIQKGRLLKRITLIFKMKFYWATDFKKDCIHMTSLNQHINKFIWKVLYLARIKNNLIHDFSEDLIKM